MNKCRVKKAAIFLMAVFLILLAMAGSVLAEDDPDAKQIGDYYPAEQASLAKREVKGNTSQPFYSVQGLGDDDVLYYTYINGVETPAYCIDHGKQNPNGEYYQYSESTNNMLGYILRHGYPNTTWGLSAQEAQFLTQAAVFGACGVPLYAVADGQHAPYWIWNHIWGDETYTEGDSVSDTGHFQNAVDLLENARNNATEEDAHFVNYWNPTSGTLQRMITPVREEVSVTVSKTSAAPDTVNSELEGNAMYASSFRGAVFSVKTYDTYLETWSESENYETGDDGTFTISGLHEGDKVHVEEIKAPKGYLLPDETVQELTLSGSENTITFSDMPAFDTGVPTLKKVKYQNQELQPSDGLKGAIFRAQYFDNDSCSGNALRTWYFETGDDGTFSYSAASLAQGYENDALYTDSQNQPRLPLGSILFTEIKSPQGYLNTQSSVKGKITQPKEGEAAVFTWITQSSGPVQVQTGEKALIGNQEILLAVKKIDASTERLIKDAVLQILDGNTVLAEWTTGESEKVLRGIFTPGRIYVLHEVQAPESYQPADDISFRFDEEGNLELLSEEAESYTTVNGIPGIVMKDVRKILLPMTGSASLFASLISGILVLSGSVSGLFLPLKKKKKAICMAALCLLFVIALAIPALADGNLSIDGGEGPEHCYRIYQLLSGTVLDEDTLWDVHIAEDIPSSLWDTLDVDAGRRSPQEIAEWMSEKIRADADGSFAVRVARAVLQEKSILAESEVFTGEVVSLSDGFYLLTSDDAQPMLVLTGNGKTLKIREKSSVPTLQKEIGEVTADGQILYGKAADSGMGRAVPYRLLGTLPSNYNAYDQYYYSFCDAHDSGTQVDLSSVTVTVQGADGSTKKDITSFADIEQAGGLLRITFADLKEAYPRLSEGESLCVQYHAFLTKDAKMGSSSNDNEAWIEYTRSPTCLEHGQSVRDKCRLYTWQMKLMKMASDSAQPLKGACFTIQDVSGAYRNTDGTWSQEKNEKSVWKTNKKGVLKVSHLDSGKYLVTETQAPEGYLPTEAFTVEIQADYADNNAVTLSVLGSGKEIQIQKVDAKAGIVQAEVTDYPVPDKPKTGDSSWLLFYLVLFGGSIFVSAAFVVGIVFRKGNHQ